MTMRSLAAILLSTFLAVHALTAQVAQPPASTLSLEQQSMRGLTTLTLAIGVYGLQSDARIDTAQIRTLIELELRRSRIAFQPLTAQTFPSAVQQAILNIRIRVTQGVMSGQTISFFLTRVALVQRVRVVRDSSLLVMVPTWDSGESPSIADAASLQDRLERQIREQLGTFLNQFMQANP